MISDDEGFYSQNASELIDWQLVATAWMSIKCVPYGTKYPADCLWRWDKMTPFDEGILSTAAVTRGQRDIIWLVGVKENSKKISH